MEFIAVVLGVKNTVCGGVVFIKIKHIADTPGNPFGKYLNIALELKVSIRNGIDSIEVVSAKAGAFNIPEKMVKEKINDLLARHYRGTAQEQMIQDCVTVLRMDEKGFFLEYKPYPLVRHIDRIYFGGSGIFLRQTGHGSEKK